MTREHRPDRNIVTAALADYVEKHGTENLTVIQRGTAVKVLAGEAADLQRLLEKAMMDPQERIVLSADLEETSGLMLRLMQPNRT